ncbi:hypothetical protein BGZ63DRAFT_421280 [Mariannaea sp. PMI_226]|nr:hypothetical protein BGZ63DRAFT_421280 [Mariannaea sp. PMI_226]
MAGSSQIALPEHWTELSAARLHRKQLAAKVEELKIACATNCQQKNVSDCPECYPKILDTMRERYCNATGREWFSQRGAFLSELDALFSDAKKRKVDLKAIEDHIESEKEAWYRWVLRTYPAFLTAGEKDVDQEMLRSMLDDPDTSREELIKGVWDALGSGSAWSSEVDTLADTIAEGQGNSDEIRKHYINFIFKDPSNWEVLPNATKYLEMYERNPEMRPEEVIDRIAQDQRASMTSQPQRNEEMSRLDSLQRAKLANDQEKQLKVKRRMAAQAAQTPTVAEELYHLSPCEKCGGVVSPQNVLSCSLCQVLTQIGGRKKLTVYCSPECYQSGHDDHVAKEHDCEAGDKCIQNQDEDDMMDDEMQTVICDACIDDRNSAVYCSVRCATLNLPQHNELKHSVQTGPDEIKSLVSPLSVLAGKTLKEGNPGLRFSPVN